MASVKPSHFLYKRKGMVKMKNVAYLRVSTENQTEKFGLDLQKQKIVDYCERNGVKIDKWYIDGGFSGSKLDRPQMQELLDDVEKGGIEAVYIYKLDRMSRDVIDTLDLLYRILPKYNVRVVSMTEDIKTENPMDKVMVTINAAMNQYEREVIRMRMSAGMMERVKKGYWMGGGRVPYGYYYDRNDGILHIKEDEAEVVRQAFDLYLSGLSTVKISRILGWKDFDVIIRQMLTRKTYIGKIVYKGVEYHGKHDPIISEEKFFEAQDMMEKRKNKSIGRRGRYMLTGLLYCGVCGAKMRYHQWSKSGTRIICYSQMTGKEYMRKSDHCDNVRAMASEVEEEVSNAFNQFVISINQKAEDEADARQIAERNIAKKSQNIKRLYKVYAESGSNELLEVIHEEELALKTMRETMPPPAMEKIHTSKIAEIKRMSDVWDDLSADNKNKVLKECVEKIIIYTGNVEIRFSSL